MAKSGKNQKEIRVRGSSELHGLAETVAGNYGITVSQYLRPKIRVILDSEPAHMKIKRDRDV